MICSFNLNIFHNLLSSRKAYLLLFFINAQGYERFTVTSNYAGCPLLKIKSKSPMECAKLAGMILMHFGQLRAYGEGNPEVIEVSKCGLCVRFNVWHSKRIVSERQITVLVIVWIISGWQAILS